MQLGVISNLPSPAWKYDIVLNPPAFAIKNNHETNVNIQRHRRGSRISSMNERELCPSVFFLGQHHISKSKCGDFRCSGSGAHTEALIKPILFEKAPHILPWYHLTLCALFIFFILRQEYLRGVCPVSPQIKHSLCIPYEMYLLRFGRGGRQVLGYINSEGPPLPIRRGHGQAA